MMRGSYGKKNYKMDLSQEEWEEQLQQDDNAFILDVRTPEEVEDGYIPGATNIDIHLGQGFLDEVEKLDKSKSYYVYCRSGARSAQACSIMAGLGFEKAYNLEGGFMNWQGEVPSNIIDYIFLYLKFKGTSALELFYFS